MVATSRFGMTIGIYSKPFGLKNAGATYQRAMTNIFKELLHHEVECYVDDLVLQLELSKADPAIADSGGLQFVGQTKRSSPRSMVSVSASCRNRNSLVIRGKSNSCVAFIPPSGTTKAKVGNPALFRQQMSMNFMHSFRHHFHFFFSFDWAFRVLGQGCLMWLSRPYVILWGVQSSQHWT